MNNQTKVDAQFLSVFNAWFNVDLIDLSNSPQVKSTAGLVASDLTKQVSDVDRLIAHLSGLLQGWSPAVAMEFVRATDTDWLFDEVTEQQLKEIIQDIINGLCHFREQKASRLS